MKSIWKSLGLAAALISSGTASAEEQVTEIDFDAPEIDEAVVVEEPTKVDDGKLTEQDVLSVCLDKRKAMMMQVTDMDRMMMLLAQGVARESKIKNDVTREVSVDRCREVYDLKEVESVESDEDESSEVSTSNSDGKVSRKKAEELAVCIDKSVLPEDALTHTWTNTPTGDAASDSAHTVGADRFDRYQTQTDSEDVPMRSIEACVDEVVAAKAQMDWLIDVSNAFSDTLNSMNEEKRLAQEEVAQKAREEQEAREAAQKEEVEKLAAARKEQEAQMQEIEAQQKERIEALRVAREALEEATRQEELARIEAAQKEEAARQQRLQELLKILQGQ